MPIKAAVLLPVSYFLVLLQDSFLPHFPIFGYLPNLAIILFVLLIFRMPSLGLSSAFFGGFFLDVFSDNFFGFNIMVLLAITLFVKLVLKKYVQIPLR